MLAIGLILGPALGAIAPVFHVCLNRIKSKMKNNISDLKICLSISDVIHNKIFVTNELELFIINSLAFQRLRRIKQLGFSSFVFPNANNTRFEHSLGAMHLSDQCWTSLFRNTKRLIQKYKPIRRIRNKIEAFEKDIDLISKNHFDDLRKVIRLAALCHDIGHGPFSHTFDDFRPTWKSLKTSTSIPNWLEPKRTKEVGHELYSVWIVNDLLSQIDDKIYHQAF
jgi:HD superfamily phosphohydrolase